MRKVSKKQSKINNKLRKVYKELADERIPVCTGCGRSDVPLSHSHIIPRSRRKDLECIKENITYHCLSTPERIGCHVYWEGNLEKKQKLLDYHTNMEYILQTDAEYYYILTELNN